MQENVTHNLGDILGLAIGEYFQHIRQIDIKELEILVVQ
jgi:hypothetical protein